MQVLHHAATGASCLAIPAHQTAHVSMAKPTWSPVKARLTGLSSKEMLSLIGELYQLSKQNKSFLHARFGDPSDAIEDTRQVIADCLYPDVLKNKPVQIARARGAVSDFCKAVSDPAAHVDIMVFFVEQGNAFTLDHGDMDERFYGALILMYRRAAGLICDWPADAQRPFRERLAAIVSSSTGLGWGYHDELAAIFRNAFTKQD